MPLCLTWGQHFWPAGTEGGNLLLTKYWRMNLTSLLQLFVWTFLGQISSLYFCSTKFSFMWFNFSSLYWFSSASRIIDVLETLLNNKTIFQNCVSFWLSLNFTRKTEKNVNATFSVNSLHGSNSETRLKKENFLFFFASSFPPQSKVEVSYFFFSSEHFFGGSRI